MIGSIPIVDNTGNAVGKLRWQGTLWAGKGEWVAEEAVAEKLKKIVASREDLKKVPFSDMWTECGVRSVKGWQGFSGWFQALSSALPAYGWKVDCANVVWPIAPEEEDEAEDGKATG